MFSPIFVFFLVSLQVFCDAAPRRVGIPLRRLPGEQELRMIKRSSVDQSACLEAHNTKRALHGASLLTWDAGLAQDAQIWANHLADIGKMQHEPGIDEGENLFVSYNSQDVTASCDDAVAAWYGEIKDYDFNNPGFSPSTGHFTQVVWKATAKVGVAKATTFKNGFYMTFIAARYSPPGNYQGQFAENVEKN